MIKQAAGTGDNDLNTGPELSCLGRFVDPSIYCQAANTCLAGQLDNITVYLFCQFTGRGNDEGPDPAARAFKQML